MSTIEELRALSKKIAEDPQAVYDLEPEQAIELRKYLDPLGTIVNGKKCYVNMSIINWRDKYLRRLHMTALIGFMYRMVDEYEPYEMELEHYNFIEQSKELKDDDLINARKQHEEKMKLLKVTAQKIVKRFLDRNLNYNPDHHLKTAHTENKADPERKDKDQAIREKCKIVESANTIDAKLQSKPDALYNYMRTHLLTTYQSAIEANMQIMGALQSMNMESDEACILLKKYLKLQDITTDMKKIVEPLLTADTLPAWEINPPVDVFYQFDRYVTNHYEQLEEVCCALYHERKDIEFSVQLYDAFKTPDAAREYKIQHESEFRNEVFTIENGATTILGPYKENRNRIDFYNKNTEVMKKIIEQTEIDHKLGADFMAKQVKSQKRKNILEAGPDSPALATYSKAMNVVAELGGKKILSQEEMEELNKAKLKARDVKEDYEVPEEAVQMNMFFPTKDEHGNDVLKRSVIYTQAEAPTFMQDPSQMNEPYQPKRTEEETIDVAYTKKTIVSKFGEKREIKVAK